MTDELLGFRVAPEIKRKVELIAKAYQANSSDVARAALDSFLGLPESEQFKVLQLYLNFKKADGWIYLAEKWLASDSYAGQSIFLSELKRVEIPAGHRLNDLKKKLEEKVDNRHHENLVSMAQAALQLGGHGVIRMALSYIEKAGDIPVDHPLAELARQLEAKLEVKQE